MVSDLPLRVDRHFANILRHTSRPVQSHLTGGACVAQASRLPLLRYVGDQQAGRLRYKRAEAGLCTAPTYITYA